MKKATTRAIYIFLIPFIFIWIGSLIANAMDNMVFEIVLGIVMLIGVFVYWLFPFLAEMAIEYNLDETTRTIKQEENLKRLSELLKDKPNLQKKYGHYLKDKSVN